MTIVLVIFGTKCSVDSSKLQIPWFGPELRLLSEKSFCKGSTCSCVGSSRFLQSFPFLKKHKVNLIVYD